MLWRKSRKSAWQYLICRITSRMLHVPPASPQNINTFSEMQFYTMLLWPLQYFIFWANGHPMSFPEASETVNRKKQGIAANLITEYWKGQKSAPCQCNLQNESYEELFGGGGGAVIEIKHAISIDPTAPGERRKLMKHTYQELENANPFQCCRQRQVSKCQTTKSIYKWFCTNIPVHLSQNLIAVIQLH